MKVLFPVPVCPITAINTSLGGRGDDWSDLVVVAAAGVAFAASPLLRKIEVIDASRDVVDGGFEEFPCVEDAGRRGKETSFSVASLPLFVSGSALESELVS
jgi:hypothetical protein